MRTAGDKEYAVADDGVDIPLQRAKARTSLARLNSPPLDSYLDAPLYYIHMSASQRAIVTSIERQVKKWKERREIEETRLHTKKFDDYLRIWDQREGWTGKGYDPERCLTLEDVGHKHRSSASTVQSQYESAFQWITGHAYRLDMWVRLFAPVLYAGRTEDQTHALGRTHISRFNRLVQSRSAPSVNETTLTPANKDKEQSAGLLEN